MKDNKNLIDECLILAIEDIRKKMSNTNSWKDAEQYAKIMCSLCEEYRKFIIADCQVMETIKKQSPIDKQN